ncbi:MAG TPA: hypothetical protein VF749_04975 [Candidatus Acidoferrum sp.]
MDNLPSNKLRKMQETNTRINDGSELALKKNTGFPQAGTRQTPGKEKFILKRLISPFCLPFTGRPM